ncbi:hypothetical protein MCHI_001728 [Candidatus Magnetoovum chiemensis]|nr:hypothetical protein MCHI_001728 [Candidatus Magnetoovum chiemensis]
MNEDTAVYNSKDTIVYNSEAALSPTLKKMIRYFFKKGANYAQYGSSPTLRCLAVYEVIAKDGTPFIVSDKDFLNDGWEFNPICWAAYKINSLGEKYVKSL